MGAVKNTYHDEICWNGMDADEQEEVAAEFEPWRPALMAFYRLDELPAKAARLKLGAAFDYLDVRTIEALQVAVKLIPRKAA